MIKMIAATFNNRPARAICGTVTAPDPKTIAFGGVATGIMKAQLAARATGTISMNGVTAIAMAKDAASGRKTAAVAVLLVISVRKTTIPATSNTMKNSGHPAPDLMTWPIQSARPLALIADASERPPPNKISTPHGSRLLDAANQPKTGHFVPQAGHNDLYSFGAFSTVIDFVNRHIGR